MILRELKLAPFAGLIDLQVVFQGGLNVVLGPNEAGKSTLVHALKMALFIPTQYDKKIYDQKIRPFLPLSGGDTVEVGLTFSVKGESYRLKKSWGSKKESRLNLPRGDFLADPLKVQEKLLELLALKEGTYQNVLIAYQAGLSQTLESLRKDQEAAHDLASILRKGILETDGVSIEKLGQAIESRYKEYFSRWDPVLKGPEGNRGIDHPYVKEVGRILAAHYERERLRRSLNQSLEYERRMDELNRKILLLTEEIASLREYIDTNRSIVEDARKRHVLELQKKALQGEEKDLREISQKWPALGQEVKGRREQLEGLKERQKHLEQEYHQAEAYELNKQRLDKFIRAEKKKQEIEEARSGLARMKVIRDEEYQRLEKIHQELDRLKTSLKAGKIFLVLAPEKSMELNVAKDLDEEALYRPAPGRPLEVSAGGQIQIRHADWHLKVKSGDMDFEKLNKSFEKRSGDYHDLLKQLGISDFSEGKKVYDEYKNQSSLVKSLSKQLMEILGSEAYEELEALSRSSDQARPIRSITDIAGERGELRGKITQAEGEIGSNTRQLAEWNKTYGSQEALLDLLLEKRAGLKERESALQNLKPLPEAIQDPEKFIKEFEQKQETLKNRENDLSGVRIVQAGLEGKAPEETREEIEVQRKESEHRLEQALVEGDAILEIRKTFQEIKSAMDSQTLEPWLEELKRVVLPLTADRYRLIAMEEKGPGKVIRADGLEIPAEVLSQGTKVGLGLALRLSMARYFLRDLDGFLILDDPLVDLDEERQRTASQVIQAFSKGKQVILFTCHPDHAGLLGGNIIRLNPL
jgi:DNA repair protein SbcC/Rad50